MNKLLNEKGFAALFITVLILAVVFVIVLSLISLASKESQILRNIISSNRAYYLAEAGIEDALIRLKNNSSLSNISYSFASEGGNINVAISENIGGSLVVVSTGEYFNSIRKIRVSYEIDLENVSFFYGAQAGAGGVLMRNNSKIIGNVFSNGNIIGAQNTNITESAISAGEKIESVRIGKDAKAYNCYSSIIQGDLFYVSGGFVDCSASGSTFESGEINPEDFPISEETVQKWKTQAEQGQIISGDYNVSGVDFLGPTYIQGNLTLNNNSNLKMQGIILVSGDLTINNNAVLDLDPNYYHSLSGVLIVEGNTRVRPGGLLRGSSQPGSYLMIVSLNNSLESAVQIDNTSDGGIFFVPYGAILLNQNIKIREAVAYKIILQENAEIEYEIGLENIFFSSGAGGGWRVLSWKEIE